jgi:hypothetical protein
MNRRRVTLQVALNLGYLLMIFLQITFALYVEQERMNFLYIVSIRNHYPDLKNDQEFKYLLFFRNVMDNIDQKIPEHHG